MMVAISNAHLSVRPDLLYDLPDLRLEAHVEHPVGLVEHQVGDSPHADLPTLQEVDQPAWCGDHDLGTVLDVAQLLPLGSATVDAGVLQLGGAAELLRHFLNENMITRITMVITMITMVITRITMVITRITMVITRITVAIDRITMVITRSTIMT